ncbi:17079_t:CDS:10, partial [Entrophospora sp. SA101]
QESDGAVKRHKIWYPRCLNFYNYLPDEEITLEEFNLFALDRLQVLKAIEGANLRDKTDEQTIKLVEEVSKLHLPLHSNDSSKSYPVQDERRKDHLSHFILRLAHYLRHWFLKYETELFRIKYLNEKKIEKLAFLKEHNFGLKYLSQSEKEELKNELMNTYPTVDFNKEEFFQTDFRKVLDLVTRRTVYLKYGMAYAPSCEQSGLVVSEFRKHLGAALERILPLLNKLNEQYIGNSYTGMNVVTGKITANDVNQGIGLPVEESLNFWKKSFSKFTADKFQKEYSYNIRHDYGLEGSRRDYAPYSCMSIVRNNVPGPNEHHGCPFRHFYESNLKATLIENGIRDENNLKKIMELAKDRHYNIACTKYFEVIKGTGGTTDDGVEEATKEPIVHPNQYYEKNEYEDETRKRSNTKNIIDEESDKLHDIDNNGEWGDDSVQEEEDEMGTRTKNF